MIYDSWPYENGLWIIKQWRVRLALRLAGWRVVHDFYDWYWTDCPIEINRSVNLPHGLTLYSHGTELTLNYRAITSR